MGKGFDCHWMEDILVKFGKTLWKHLDEKAEMLGADSVRNYWTLRDIRHVSF